jgi:hypothetical protein
LQDERLFCKLLMKEWNAPVAQLDRASDFGSEGWGFDSLRVHEYFKPAGFQSIISIERYSWSTNHEVYKKDLRRGE